MVLYVLYKIGQFIAMYMPLKFSFWLGCRITDIHFSLSKKDTELVTNNIKTALGKSAEESSIYAHKIFRNFSKYLVEFLRFSKMDKDYIEKNVTVVGADNIKNALKLNKGILAFSAHLGNWEWGGALLAQLGFPTSVIALAHKDKNINDLFIKTRNDKGVKNIPLGGSARKSLQLLAKNELVGILSDRDFSDNSIPVSFFGRPALMPAGIGLLGVMSKSPIVPVFITREKGLKYKLSIEKPIEYTVTGDRKTDIRNIVQAAASVIERYVRLYPEQWFMFADPWKDAGAK